MQAAKEAFADIPTFKIDGEMLELAEHIIATKKGSFDPTKFDDRYETALSKLIKAKMEGRTLPKKNKTKIPKASNLLDALRQSANVGQGSKKKAALQKTSSKQKQPASQRKAS